MRANLSRRICALAAGVLALSVFAPGIAGANEPGRYIVVLQDGIDAGRVADEHSAAHGARVSFVYTHALNGYAAQMTPQAAARVENDPRVDYVDVDLPQHAFAQTLGTGVDRIDGELSTTAKINGIDERVDVDIAILDTGVADHEDLDVVARTNCAKGGPFNKKCTDGDGFDGDGHGTHVGGIAAAIDNGIGVVGVAPGARLHSVKVLDDRGSGYTSWIIAGIDWVTARAATIEVANMSLGGSGYTSSYHTALKNSVAKGVVYTVAAGNSAKDIYGSDGKFGTSDDTQPAAFPEAATISALADADGKPGGLATTRTAYSICTEDKDDSMACFSNYSRSVDASNPVTSSGKAIDLALPGYLIYSTYPNNSYYTVSGTSQAAPHAAGLAGLYVAKNGRATTAAGVATIRQALIDSGQSMTGTNGLTTLDDPDGNYENIGWAAAI